MTLRVTLPAADFAAARRRVPAPLLLGLLGVCAFGPAEAGLNIWTTHGPAGGPVLALAIAPGSPGTIYAASGSAGIFKSVDGGASWHATNAGLQGFFLDDVTLDPRTPSVVYVAAFQGASTLYRSADEGATWIGMGPDIPPGVRALAVDPVTPTTLYASILFRPFLVKTTDGGATWDSIAEFPDEVRDVAIDPRTPTTLYAGVFRATPSGGILMKSLDGGQNWSAISSGLSDPATSRRYDVLRVVIDPADSAIVYISTSGGGFKSIDGGGAWAAIDHPVLAIDPVVTTTVYSGTRTDGIFKSSDAGSTWIELNRGLADLRVSDVAVDPRTPRIVYAATDSGVFVLEQGPDLDPPEVALTAPAEGTIVSGTINLTAAATDDVAVAGVQFLLNGEPLGPEDTSSPYEVPWDARSVPNGVQALAATARDVAGRLSTSSIVNVTVANAPAPTHPRKRLEEEDGILAPEGAWTVSGDSDFGVAFSGGTAAWTEAAGATVTFTFKGTGVRWLGFGCERCGVAEVLVDGGRVATVDTFSPQRPASSQVMYTSPRLDMRTHTLTIVVTGTKNTASTGRLIATDGIEPLTDGAGKAQPQSLRSH
jgi:photosystem II stability/assembly factor-like uncharacterized protein